MSEITDFLAAALTTTAAMAVMLGIVFVHFYRRHRRPCYSYWAMSWWALALFTGSNAYYLSVREAPVEEPARIVVAVLTMLAGLLQVAWLALGTYMLANEREVPRHLGKLLVAGCALLSVGLVFGAGFEPANGMLRYFLRVGMRAWIAGLVLLSMGLWLTHFLRDRPRRVGPVVVTVAFLLTAFSHLYQGLVATAFLLGRSMPTLFYLGLTETFLQVLTGVGLLLWVLEELTGTLEERVRAQTSELRRVNQDLEAFAHSVAHDLKAPLRAINGYSSMLEERLEERLGPSVPEDLRRLLNDVRDNTENMGRLIEDLLEFARVGRTEMAISEVQMRELVQTVFSDLMGLEGERAVDFSVAQLPTIHADRALVRQVWMNLLQNALKFSRGREVTRIEVDYVEKPDHWVFHVRDNGAGFDMTYVDKLFGVFQRLHYADEFPGTGVGLATVQRIVHRHGGEVWAEAEVDVGASIFFELPRTPPKPR